jgi:hypothetical protein
LLATFSLPGAHSFLRLRLFRSFADLEIQLCFATRDLLLRRLFHSSNCSVARADRNQLCNFRLNFYHELRKNTSTFSGKISFPRVTRFVNERDRASSRIRQFIFSRAIAHSQIEFRTGSDSQALGNADEKLHSQTLRMHR